MIDAQQRATTSVLHSNYFIDLEHDGQSWRVIAITHCFNGSSLVPPGFNYPDQATAEQYARAAMSVQLSGRRRR
jgi:hypothetical protein